MQPLDKNLRSKLEQTIKNARDIAESAARASLEQLGLSEAAPSSHLSKTDCELHRTLRIHGRQLGDIRNPETNEQEIDLLIEEVAYEHWHRMLFARFLAENNLLMYPDPVNPVPVSLEECEDLAIDEGAKNGWELASRFAARMLPQIFRPDSPVFQLVLPPEHEQKLERLVAEFPQEVFMASDSLGWVYQFWQTKKNDEINDSGVKIGARELPAVTQRFTEPYMVSFLLDNSLGAWWANQRLTLKDMINAENEEELRLKAALPGLPLSYLRFVKNKDGKWTPAAGTFDNWPRHLSELKALDPCCGSGHFLVAALLMLVPIRIQLEGLNARDAVDAVLRENIHGLEIDQRCVEIAAFALALTAWRYPGTGGYRTLPDLHIACTGLSVSVAKEEWKRLSLEKHNLRIAMEWMYDTFKNAPIFGSLLNPIKSNAAIIVDWEELSGVLEQVLHKEQTIEQHEVGVVAHGLAKATTLLAGKYHWIITNVPYLARGKQSEILCNFCEERYFEAKNDLATVFLDRCLELCEKGGTASVVLPQNWLFLSTYHKFRKKLLMNETWLLIARLGPRAFETISGEVVKAILLIINRRNESFDFRLQLAGDEIGADNRQIICGLDVSSQKNAAEKGALLSSVEIDRVEQRKQLGNPDARVVISENASYELLSKYAHGVHGFGSKDSPRFFRQFWEIIGPNNDWQLMETTVEHISFYGGLEQIVFWQQGKGILADLSKQGMAIPAGEIAWGKKGITVSQMRNLPCTLHTGEIFDKNVAVILPSNPANLSAIWCFCSSPNYNEAVRRIDQKLNVTNATLVKVPFDLDYWTAVAQEKYPNGLPKPYSENPTQWIFHGHPDRSNDPLQVAVARLLGYRWPAELDSTMELSDEAYALVKKSEALLSLTDKDGIVCIPSVRGEASAVDRLLNLLAAAYGDTWSNDKLVYLLKQADHAGKSLETWLREKFFTQHCKLFQNRPFIWHIWDGLSDGFAVLVNYHKLDRKNLEVLTYTYLGDWINSQKQDKANRVDGAAEKLDAAEVLKKRLELILHGETPYDIFVRWKPIEEQPIGWEPDLNDGVRINIRPFMSVPDVGKKGAGILRDKPNIDWGKDRGKDVESAPWYNMDKGDRVNDHHLTLEEKRTAREVKARGAPHG